MEKNNETKYFLFGSIPVTILMDEGFDELLKEVTEDQELMDGMTYVYDPKEQSIVDLLNAYQGWQKYAVLDEAEYTKIETALDPSLKKYKFVSERIIRASNVEQAKILFAESSYTFAADAKCIPMREPLEKRG